MLGVVTEKFQKLAAKLSREKKLTEENEEQGEERLKSWV